MLASCTAIAGSMIVACSVGTKLTDDQRRGKQIYEGLCDKCHKLIPPRDLSDSQWEIAVEKYGIKLKLRPEEEHALKDYLTRANDSDFRE